jgi:hypothetical protein
MSIISTQGNRDGDEALIEQQQSAASTRGMTFRDRSVVDERLGEDAPIGFPGIPGFQIAAASPGVPIAQASNTKAIGATDLLYVLAQVPLIHEPLAQLGA